CDDGGAVGIVDGLRRVRAEILDLMSVPDEPVAHDVFDRKARVIAANSHAHGHTPSDAPLTAPVPFRTCARASATTWLVVNPKSRCSIARGADIPSVLMPRMAPVSLA